MDHDATLLDQFTRQARPFSDSPAMGDVAAIDRLADLARVDAQSHCLDVGCGPGLVATRIAARAAHVTGIDATPAMIERAGELARERGIANVTWQVGSAYALPFADGTFDVVVTRFAFHHMQRPADALREMLRVLRPGGTIAVCDAVASNEPARAQAFNDFERLRDPSTVRFLTEPELLGVLRDGGSAPDTVFRYRIPVELEGLLATSFPANDDREGCRRIVREAVADDALGASTRESHGRLYFDYAVLIAAARPPGTSAGISSS